MTRVGHVRESGLVRALVVAVLAIVVGVLTTGEAMAMPAISNYGAPTYVYDGPAGLSSPDTVVAGARASPERPGATSWVSAVSVRDDGDAANEVPDALVLARGGTNTAERFASGSGVTVGADGALSGVSVNSGRTLQEAVEGIPHKQVGVTTAGDVRTAGGTVVRDPLPGNPGHCLLSGCTAEAFSRLFTRTIKNPGQ